LSETAFNRLPGDRVSPSIFLNFAFELRSLDFRRGYRHFFALEQLLLAKRIVISPAAGRSFQQRGEGRS